jgi:hypothetical protein
MRRSATSLAKSTADYVATLEKHFSPAVPRAPKGNNIVVDTAKGAWITDITGRKYLDFQTGIGVVSTGHCHPRCVPPVAGGAVLHAHGGGAPPGGAGALRHAGRRRRGFRARRRRLARGECGGAACSSAATRPRRHREG